MPTPSPIIEPIWGAQLGIMIRWLISGMAATPSTRPNRAMPMGRPMATSDPKASSRITTAAPIPISSAALPAGSSKLKNSSPPASACSPPAWSASASTAFNRSRSSTRISASTGYWTVSRATRPSGERASLTSSTLSSPANVARSRARSASAAGSAAKVAPSSGAATTRAVMPARSEAAEVSSSMACWESTPGTSKLSSMVRPKTADEVSTTAAARAHKPITINGRRADHRPSRYSTGVTAPLLPPPGGAREPGRTPPSGAALRS